MNNPSSPKAPGRRRFMRTGCLVSAAAGITIIGGGTAVLTYPPKIDLPSSISGEKNMDKRILIAYGSKAGSTAEIAVKMGETLSKQGQPVDVLPVSKVTDLSPYTAIIVGSAIRIGKPLPEVMTFIEKNQAALKQKLFSMFVVCMTLSEDTEANRQTVSAYLEPVRALVKPASEGLFAGAMNLNKLPLFERLMIKAMKSQVGDFRK